MKYGKIWGTTEVIARNPAFELHRLEVKKDGYCSKHYHKVKSNLFFIESGRLRIEQWKPEENVTLIDTIILEKGQSTAVPNLTAHRFTAIEDSIVYEFYWAEIQPEDIFREDTGGLNHG